MYWLNFIVLSCFVSFFHSTTAAPVLVSRVSDLEARLARRAPTRGHLQKRVLKTSDVRIPITAQKTNGVLYANPQDPKDGTLIVKASPTPAEADRMTWDHIVPLHFIIKNLLTPAALHKIETDGEYLKRFIAAINHPENLMPLEQEVDQGKGSLFNNDNVSNFSIKKLIGIRDLFHMYLPGGKKYMEASRAVNRIIRGVDEIKVQNPDPKLGDKTRKAWDETLALYIQGLEKLIKDRGGK